MEEDSLSERSLEEKSQFRGSGSRFPALNKNNQIKPKGG